MIKIINQPRLLVVCIYAMTPLNADCTDIKYTELVHDVKIFKKTISPSIEEISINGFLIFFGKSLDTL